MNDSSSGEQVPLQTNNKFNLAHVFVLVILVVVGVVASYNLGIKPADSGVKAFVEETQDTSTGRLGDGKVLRVGMEAAYAPYNWQTTTPSQYTMPIANLPGTYADGYDVQIAKKIASGLGMEAVAVKMSFSGLIDALNSGQIDIICAGMSESAQRAQSVDFSHSYFDGGFGLMVKRGSKYENAHSLSEFNGASVLGQKATLLDSVIDDIDGVIHLNPVESVPNQISHLLQGTCDAITYNVENEDGLLGVDSNLVPITFAEGEGFKTKIPDNAAIKKGQKQSLDKINEIVDSIPQKERMAIWKACQMRQPV